MVRIDFIIIILAILTGNECESSSLNPAASRPNIVLILADDLGYNDVSYNGATEIKTPNIDRLASEGVIFSNGYVADPICGPSRAGILTGRYPARFGMSSNFAYASFDHKHGLPVTETTFATRVKNAGYRTGVVGKWHLGAAPPFHPLNRGFSFFFGFLGGAHDYFKVDVTQSSDNDGLVPLGENKGATGFTGYLTDALTDRAIDFIGSPQAAPFFLYLSYNAPHGPLQAPEHLIKKYGDIVDEHRRLYLAMVDALDQNVGRILEALERSDHRDDTLVFFLSDNGGVYPRRSGKDNRTWADNGQLRGGKSSLFEGGIRVPFLGSWPARWPQGETYEPMVISLDVAATAYALAGVYAEPEYPLDGVNLDPFVRGQLTGRPHEALFWRKWRRETDQFAYACRVGDTKLVKDTGGGRPMLFDLRSDPGETQDRFSEERDTAVRLARLWNNWNQGNMRDRFVPGLLYRQKLRDFTVEMAKSRDAYTIAPFQILLNSDD